MHLLESGEMYLETIYMLSKTRRAVRSIDIVDSMGYSKPSVSRAVGILKKGGFILVDESGYITLTAEGEDVAQKIFERHTVLTDFLVSIGVDRQTASDDACKIEHDISDATLSAIKKQLGK